MKQSALRLRAPFGALDTATGDDALAPGTLASLDDLVWVGQGDDLRLEVPAGPAARLTPPGYEVVALHRLPDERLLMVTSTGVRVGTQAAAGGTITAGANLFALATDATRRASFAQVGDVTLIATTTGVGTAAGDYGEPEVLLSFWKAPASGALVDTVSQVRAPATPRLSLTSDEATGEDGLPDGHYGVALAWRLFDGSIGPISEVVHVSLGAPATGSTHTLTLAFTSLGGETPATLRAAGVQSLVVLLSEPLEYLATPSAQNVAERIARYGPLYVAGESPTLETLLAGIGASAYEAPAPVTITTVRTTAEALVASEAPPTDHLLQHGLAAGCAYAFGAQALLGDLVRAMRPPDALSLFHDAVAQSVAGYQAVWIEVEIALPSGSVFLKGPTRYVPAAAATSAETTGDRDTTAPAYNYGAWGYPDVRARALRIVSHQVGSTTGSMVEYPMRAASAGNVSYASVPGALDLTSLGTALLDVTFFVSRLPVVSSATEALPSSLAYAPAFEPLHLRAARVQPVGVRAQRLLGFATQAEPVGEAQFGDFPVLVLGSGSIYALSLTGGEVSSAAPITERYGVVGRAAFCTADGAVAALTTGGLFLLTPHLQGPALTAVLSGSGGDAGLLESVTPEASIAFVAIDPSEGLYAGAAQRRRELWLCPSAGVNGKTYAFALGAGRWSRLSRARRGFGVGAYEVPLSVGADGKVYFEMADPDADITFSLATRRFTAPAADGRPDPYTARRITEVAVRARPLPAQTLVELAAEDESGHLVEVAAGVVLRPADELGGTPRQRFPVYRGHGYRFVLAASGTAKASDGAALHAFELAYDAPQPHRSLA